MSYRINNVSVVPPVGSVVAHTSNTIPSGWLLCNGDPYSRTTYSALFGVIQTAYGEGNGTTTFNVPNFQAAFLRGAGTQTYPTGVGGTTYAASAINTAQGTALLNHYHGINDTTHYHSITVGTHNHSLSQTSHNHGLSSQSNILTAKNNGSLVYPQVNPAAIITGPDPSTDQANDTFTIDGNKSGIANNTVINTTGITQTNATGGTELIPFNLSLIHI